MGAIGPEGGCSRGADPFAAALMPAFLLAQPLLQRLPQLVPAQFVDLGAFFGVQMAFGHFPDPFFGDGGLCRFLCFHIKRWFKCFEIPSKNLIETVKVPLVFHQRCPGQIVKIIHRARGQILFQPFQQAEKFPKRHRDFCCAQF